MNTKPDRPAAPAAAAKYRGRSSARAKIDARVIAVWCLVVVAGGAVAAIVWEPWQHLPSAQEQTLQAPDLTLTPPPILSTPSLAGASLATTGQNPAPYQYDPIKDQHWDPRLGHEHWHNGRPPANPGTTAASASSIQNPQPWQYDPIANQHWVPGAAHEHWHAGKPPANAGTTAAPVTATSSIQNPQPWQYDPVTNQHWVADHQHWHSGRPPANAGTTTTTTAPAGSPIRLPAPGTVPSSIQNPQPWQYDEANDQHWQPDHAHWHLQSRQRPSHPQAEAGPLPQQQRPDADAAARERRHDRDQPGGRPVVDGPRRAIRML